MPAEEGLPGEEVHQVEFHGSNEGAIGAGQRSHLGRGGNALAALLQLAGNPQAACQEKGHAHRSPLHRHLPAGHLQGVRSLGVSRA